MFLHMYLFKKNLSLILIKNILKTLHQKYANLRLHTFR